MTFDKKTEYLRIIAQLFMRYGFKSVGVDDISKELGISKKTLYQEFKDKNDIVDQVTAMVIGEEQTMVCSIADKSENAIDEVIELAKLIGAKHENIHPSIHFELKKYYPRAFKRFEEHKHNHVFNCIKSNLDRGINEALYRGNINTDIIAGIFVNKMEMFIDRDSFGDKEYSFQEVYFEMMRYHIRGIASEKGREYLKNRIQQDKIDL